MKSSKRVIRMLKELRGRIDDLIENFDKEIGNKKGDTKHKKNQSEMKHIITEMNIRGNQQQIR